MQKQALHQRFEQQIRESELLIYKVCRIYACTAADRQDLFQEIVIQLWKAYPRFRGDSKFSTWLYKVAINTAITGLRKEKRSIETYGHGSMPTQVSDVDHDHVQEEQFRQLYAAIGQLPEIEKALVMLYLEDKSYQEMEEILGINEGNLRVKMNRIKEKLRQLTKNTCHGVR